MPKNIIYVCPFPMLNVVIVYHNGDLDLESRFSLEYKDFEIQIEIRKREKTVLETHPDIYSVCTGKTVLFSELYASTRCTECITMAKYKKRLQQHLKKYFRNLRKNISDPMCLLRYYIKQQRYREARSFLVNYPSTPDIKMLEFYTHRKIEEDREKIHFSNSLKILSEIFGSENFGLRIPNIPKIDTTYYEKFLEICSELDEATRTVFLLGNIELVPETRIAGILKDLEISKRYLYVYASVKLAEYFIVIGKTRLGCWFLMCACSKLNLGCDVALRNEFVYILLETVKEPQWRNAIEKNIKGYFQKTYGKNILPEYGRYIELEQCIGKEKQEPITMENMHHLYRLNIFPEDIQDYYTDGFRIQCKRTIYVDGLLLEDGGFLPVYMSGKEMVFHVDRVYRDINIKGVLLNNGCLVECPKKMKRYPTICPKVVSLTLNIPPREASSPESHSENTSSVDREEVRIVFKLENIPMGIGMAKKYGKIEDNGDTVAVILPKKIKRFTMWMELEKDIFEDHTYDISDINIL